MARYRFVTASHTLGDETQTVEILTPIEVKKIASDAIHVSMTALTAEVKRAVEAARVAEENAATAQEEVSRLVETARDVFRDVIEEQLAPYYRLLSKHLHIELPPIEDRTREMGRASLWNQSDSVTPQPSSDENLTEQRTNFISLLHNRGTHHAN